MKVTDDGIYEAPIDKLWRYVNDEMMHQHRSFKTSKVLEQKGSAVTLETDVTDPGGKTWHKETWKMVFNPPKGFDVEYLAGPWKGSKHTHTYTPMGNRTRVDVVGDFRIQGLDDAGTKKAVLAYFEEAFNEDSAALKKYK